jgi:pilus assembly protein CpaE
MFSLLDSAANQNDGRDGAAREPFSAFVSDDFTRQTLVRVAAELGWPAGAVERGGMGECARSLGVLGAPHTLVVDVTDSLDPARELADLVQVLGGDTRIITVGSKNDVNLLRDLIAAGAADYMLKPIDPEILCEALRRVEPDTPVESRAPGKITVFTGARGGIGTSTLALNTAWIIAHEIKRSVALVDLDLHFGSLALALDAEPGHGLFEALHSPERIDEVFIDRALVREGERLFLLAAEEPLDTPPEVEPEGLASLLEHLLSRFEHVVIDLPRALLTERCGDLAGVSEVVIATDLSLVGLRDANRLKALIAEAAPEIDIKLVANMVRNSRPGQLSAAEFERSLGCGLAARVPLDEKAAGRSAHSGQPMARDAKRCKASAAIRHLAQDLAGEGKQRKGWLR